MSSSAESQRCGGILTALTLVAFSISLSGQAVAVNLTANSGVAFTVKDSIEVTRILYGYDYGQAIRHSPNNRRFLVLLYRGDLSRNGNWLEFVSGGMDSFDAARDTRTVAELFSPDHDINHLLSLPLRWIDDETIAFTWSGADEISQVNTLNLRTGERRVLTHASRDIEYFDIASDRKTLVYLSRRDARACVSPGRCESPESSKFNDMVRRGFVVPDDVRAPSTLLRGHTTDRQNGSDSLLYLAHESDGYRETPVDIDLYILSPVLPLLSPDGKQVVVAGRPARVPSEWDRYSDPQIMKNVALARKYPLEPLQLAQLWILRTDTIVARPLWDVPYSSAPGLSWSADSKLLTIANTGLPVKLDSSEPIEHVNVEFEIATGRYSIRPNKKLQRMSPDQARSKKVRIVIQESPNTPPAIWAEDTRGPRALMLRDLNPGLAAKFSLGKTQYVRWTDSAGRRWSGRLYYPVGFEKGARYPLVILTIPPWALLPNQYSLRGNELTACVTSVAQPLANQTMAVLVMSRPDVPEAAAIGTPQEGPVVVAGYESAIQFLDGIGLVDSGRVGLIGYSRTGYHVQYALTHSEFPFAAAIASDNADMSYFQYVLSGLSWVRDGFEQVNGTLPIGAALTAWIENAPGFNADKISSPLRIEITSGGLTALLGKWELFAQLRNLNKPVELYVVPDVEHGSHGLMRPDQQMASLSGAVDWMDFWLNGVERVGEGMTEQYQQWRRLRASQQ